MERVIEALENLGISHSDAELYVILSKRGPQNEKYLKNSLKIPIKKLRDNLRNLEKKGIIKKTNEQPTQFFALTFEKAIDLLVKIRINEMKTIKQKRKNLLIP